MAKRMAAVRPRRRVQETFRFIAEVPDVEVYGFLLGASAHESLSRMVRKRWLDLHHLTGENFLLVLFEPPPALEDSFREYWRNRIGSSFGKTWKEWKSTQDPGMAYDYLEQFKPKLRASQLPCLVLFTDVEGREAIIRRIPNWDEDSLYQLFLGIAEAVRESYAVPRRDRLEFLRESLTSPTARTRAYLGYVSSKAVSYMKRNPAKVVATTASLALALATSNVLPLAPTFLTVLSVIKERVQSSE